MWHILNVANAESVLLITIIFFVYIFLSPGLPWWLSSKECAWQCRRHRRFGFDPWVRKIAWRRKWQPTPVFLPGKTHGQRSLVGYSPWGCTEHTHIHKCICCAVLTQLCLTLRDPVDCIYSHYRIRFIILFTQIIHKKQKQTNKRKRFKSYSTVPWRVQ